MNIVDWLIKNSFLFLGSPLSGKLPVDVDIISKVTSVDYYSSKVFAFRLPFIENVMAFEFSELSVMLNYDQPLNLLSYLGSFNPNPLSVFSVKFFGSIFPKVFAVVNKVRDVLNNNYLKQVYTGILSYEYGCSEEELNTNFVDCLVNYLFFEEFNKDCVFYASVADSFSAKAIEYYVKQNFCQNPTVVTVPYGVNIANEQIVNNWIAEKEGVYEDFVVSLFDVGIDIENLVDAYTKYFIVAFALQNITDGGVVEYLIDNCSDFDCVYGYLDGMGLLINLDLNGLEGVFGDFIEKVREYYLSADINSLQVMNFVYQDTFISPKYSEFTTPYISSIFYPLSGFFVPGDFKKDTGKGNILVSKSPVRDFVLLSDDTGVAYVFPTVCPPVGVDREYNVEYCENALKQLIVLGRQ